MLPELEPYIARYYDRWLDYSQRICYCLGIRNEAYDVMADTLEEFCRKSNKDLTKLLVTGYTDDCKLFFSVCKGIRLTAINVLRNRPIRALSDGLDRHLFHLPDLTDENDSNEATNEEREAEAMFRDDSFITPISISGNTPKIPIIHLKWRRRVYSDGTPYLSRYYGMEFRRAGKVTKSIRRTTHVEALKAALQYQMQHTI